MKKKFLSIILTLAILTTFLSAVTVAANDANYIVLVVDVSGPVSFMNNNGQVMYRADSAIEYVKDSSKQFISKTLQNSTNTYIAIVSYHDTALQNCSFTSNENQLINCINNLYARDTGGNLYSGLQEAHNLLTSVWGTKNVVVVSTGLCLGPYSDTGRYDETVVGSFLANAATGINEYKYANSVHFIADTIKEYGTLYTIGIFQTMENVPQSGKPIAEFLKLFVKDLATPPDKFYSVENVDDLSNTFNNIADKILPTPQQDIKIMVNGQYIYCDVPPQIINDRTMVPVRAIFEAIGAKVDWYPEKQKVYAEKWYEPTQGWIFASFTIGSNIMTNSFGEIQSYIESPAIIIDGRTFVPVRAAAEAFNYNVGWDAETRTVIIHE